MALTYGVRTRTSGTAYRAAPYKKPSTPTFRTDASSGGGYGAGITGATTQPGSPSGVAGLWPSVTLTPQAVTSPSGGSTTPVATPNYNMPDPADYKTAIQNDAIYKDAVQNYEAQRQALVRQLLGGVQTALVRYGEVPSFDYTFGDEYLTSSASNPVDEITKSLAAQNTQAGLSTTAQIKKGYDDAYRSTMNQLAARGILRSGETGYQSGQLNQWLLFNRYNAANSLTDYLNQMYGGYSQSQNSARQSLLDAMNQAIQRLLANPAGGRGSSGGGGGGSGGGGSAGPGIGPGGSEYVDPASYGGNLIPSWGVPSETPAGADEAARRGGGFGGNVPAAPTTIVASPSYSGPTNSNLSGNYSPPSGPTAAQLAAAGQRMLQGMFR